MYRIVASDMDETFLDGEHKIPAVNVEAIRRMREAGVLFVPSSGRPYASIMSNFADIDRSLMEGSYVISFNGGFINRYGDPEPLTTCAIDAAVAQDVYARGRAEGFCMHVNAADGRIFTCNEPESERSYLESVSGVIHFDAADEPDLSFLGDEGPVKVIYMSEDFEALQELGASLAPEMAARGTEVTYSSGRYLEFMPSGVNKGTGLMRLAEMLGVDPSETVGVGDSANDLAMIQMAGLGVGVANVTDDVRPHCDVVLETTGMDGAFGELVDRFIVQ